MRTFDPPQQSLSPARGSTHPDAVSVPCLQLIVELEAAELV